MKSAISGNKGIKGNQGRAHLEAERLERRVERGLLYRRAHFDSCEEDGRGDPQHRLQSDLRPLGRWAHHQCVARARVAQAHGGADGARPDALQIHRLLPMHLYQTGWPLLEAVTAVEHRDARCELASVCAQPHEGFLRAPIIHDLKGERHRGSRRIQWHRHRRHTASVNAATAARTAAPAPATTTTAGPTAPTTATPTPSPPARLSAGVGIGGHGQERRHGSVEGRRQVMADGIQECFHAHAVK